ncbi:diacylglycerol kinase, partial [Streptococcus agalactiae]|nr:diacylglycerol kinase [Streptococcus agalactiae]MCC9754763.1 diacylglycerol kinase [Streptococcus agalactiae]MCC9959989.1 diacylglycerol kinase [Streptococcus agalactiae]MDE7487154.1 diacylglycerol kinase [Streptococcus agalactiae]MDE7537060.1 diacylglycerol kinase [Streptococcus agalactiae]
RVEYIKTSYLTIEPLSDERMMINLDGEYGGDAPITLANLKNHIRFFANTDEISDDALVLDKDELAIEAIAQKFANEVDDLEGLGD